MQQLRRSVGDLRKGKVVTILSVNGQMILEQDGPISQARAHQIRNAWQDWFEGRPQALCALTGKTADALRAEMKTLY